MVLSLHSISVYTTLTHACFAQNWFYGMRNVNHTHTTVLHMVLADTESKMNTVLLIIRAAPFIKRQT